MYLEYFDSGAVKLTDVEMSTRKEEIFLSVLWKQEFWNAIKHWSKGRGSEGKMWARDFPVFFVRSNG